jgi:hypothetical protein
MDAISEAISSYDRVDVLCSVSLDDDPNCRKKETHLEGHSIEKMGYT